MEQIKQFILDYWQFLVAGGVFIISLVTSIIVIVKKSGGKVSLWDAMKTALMEKIPGWIAAVEVGGSGEAKKNAVVNMAVKEAASVIGRKLSDEETELVIALAGKYIEEVLSCPQKKTTNVLNRKVKYRVE